MLPPSSASIGSIIFFVVSFAIPSRDRRKSVCLLRSPLVFCNQHCENRSQQHENERLNKSYKHFEEIKRNRQDRRQPRHHRGHRLENAFAGINISEQSKTERNRSKYDRYHLEPADGKKDDNNEDLDDSGRLTFWAKQLFQEAADTVSLNRPDKPHHEKYCRHCGRHVQVRVATAQQRPIDMENSGSVVVSPADCSDSRNQPKPVHEQNKNENRGIEPKSLSHEVAADDVFQEVVQTLNQPFPKILYAAGDDLDPTGCDLCKNDNAGGYDPGHQHRVCNSKAAHLNKHLRF